MTEIALVFKEGEEYKIEKVDSEKVGDYYQLKSVPAFANNLAYNDIISVESDCGELFFEKLIAASGHSTLHIVVFRHQVLNEIVKVIELFGLKPNYLHGNNYLVIDVPIDVPYKS